MLKRFFLNVLALIISLIVGTSLWYFNRPLPKNITNQAIFEGITYTRIVEADVPRITHIVAIELSNPDIRFFATPSDDIDGFDYSARTTSGFLEEFDLQVAINGDFFDPWHSYSPFDYYPKIGDGVNARGLTIANGDISADGYAPNLSQTLYITADNHASFSIPIASVETAISGNVLLIENGEYIVEGESTYLNNRHPRTAIALDQNAETLLFFVVDGRQHNYSHGATFPELADIIIANGGYIALNLDGGGSTALVRETAQGKSLLMNSAIHTRIPFRERPVANHFGVYAMPLGD